MGYTKGVILFSMDITITIDEDLQVAGIVENILRNLEYMCHNATNGSRLSTPSFTIQNICCHKCFLKFESNLEFSRWILSEIFPCFCPCSYISSNSNVMEG